MSTGGGPTSGTQTSCTGVVHRRVGSQLGSHSRGAAQPHPHACAASPAPIDDVPPRRCAFEHFEHNVIGIGFLFRIFESADSREFDG